MHVFGVYCVLLCVCARWLGVEWNARVYVREAMDLNSVEVTIAWMGGGRMWCRARCTPSEVMPVPDAQASGNIRYQ